MSDTFEITYQVDDGYRSGFRPQYCEVSIDDLEDDMSESDIENLFYERIQEDFNQNITTSSNDKDRFIKWAKEIISVNK